MRGARIPALFMALTILLGAGAARGASTDGVNPCNTPDPGFGDYHPWDRGIAFGQALIPKRGALDSRGAFDLILHFHGHEAARKAFIPVGGGIVMVGIDEGVGSRAYARRFSDPRAFQKLVTSIAERVASKNGRPRARLRHLALTSWSAGYGAVRGILQNPGDVKIDAVVLLDSLHAGYLDPQTKQLKTDGLSPFASFADRAKRGRGFWFQTHSAIETYGYASTREVSHWLVGELGGALRKGRRGDPLGLQLVELFDQGNLHVRGYAGRGKRDHCAHLGMLAVVVKAHLARRWRRVQSASK